MRRKQMHRSRHGAVLVEVALIAPLVMLLLLGQIAGGIGVFRMHQVTALANEGARWASVHGPRYAIRHGLDLPGADEVFHYAIQPLATTMDRDNLECEVQWNEEMTTVSVSVRYRWIANFMGRELTVNGYSELPVSN